MSNSSHDSRAHESSLPCTADQHEDQAILGRTYLIAGTCYQPKMRTYAPFDSGGKCLALELPSSAKAHIASLRYCQLDDKATCPLSYDAYLRLSSKGCSRNVSYLSWRLRLRLFNAKLLAKLVYNDCNAVPMLGSEDVMDQRSLPSS